MENSFKAVMMPAIMDIQALKANLKSLRFGQNIRYQPEVDSTNSWATRTKDAAVGDVFLSDFQTSGYGRLKAPWEAPRGKNILMTFIAEVPRDPSKVPQLTLVSGVAFALALKKHGLSVVLKWPNDLMVHQKKLGGILCESDGHIVRIGVGINVNSTPADYSEEIRPLVTSTLRELGHEIPLESLIATCLDCFEATRTLYDNEGSAALIAQWNQLTFPRGTNIFVHEDQKSFEAKYQGLSPDGFLLVQVNDRIEKIISGTITLN